MKKIIMFLICAVILLICILVAGAYAVQIIALKDFDIGIYPDLSLIWFRGNNEYFMILMLIYGMIVGYMIINLFFDKKSRMKRKEKRRLSKDEKVSFSHLASKHEMKKGTLRLEFDKDGNLKTRSLRLFFDKIGNPFKKFWNKSIRGINAMKTKISISDVHLMNERRMYKIGDKITQFRAGVPLFTYKNRVYVDPGQNHTLIIGTTSSGKTFSFIHILIEVSRMAGESMIINDMKGELIQEHRAALIQSGYDVVEINFINPEFSAGWNILGLVVEQYRMAVREQIKESEKGNMVKANISKARELLRDLSNTLFFDENEKDKFWSQKAADLFEGLVLLMLEDTTAECIRKYNTTKDLRDRLQNRLSDLDQDSNESKKIIDALMEYDRKIHELSDIPLEDNRINLKSVKTLSVWGNEQVQVGKTMVSRLKLYLDKYKTTDNESVLKLADYVDAPENTKGSIQSTFTAKIDVTLINDDLVKMLSHQTFDMEDIGKKKMAIFLCVHDEKTTYYPLVTIFIKQLYEEMVKVSRLYEDLKLPVPVNIVYDEFGISPPLKDIQSMLAAMRSRGIRMNMVIQDYSQLDKNYGRDGSGAIKSNVMNTIYLLGGNNQTVEEISKMAGKRLVWNKEKGSYDTEPLVSPDRLRRLSVGEVLVLRQRRNPALTRFTGYSDYVFYKKLHQLKIDDQKHESHPDIQLFKPKGQAKKTESTGNSGVELPPKQVERKEIAKQEISKMRPSERSADRE